METLNENSNTCNITGYGGCSLPRHQDHDECILHCSKEEARRDYHMAKRELIEFKTQLIEYILNCVFQHKEETEQFNKALLTKYLRDPRSFKNDDVKLKLRNETIVFDFIAFPVFDERDDWNYVPLLNLLGKIHFNYCKFYVAWLEIKEVEVYFQDCEFFDHWNINNYEMLENVDDIIYQDCDFHEDVSISFDDSLNKKLVLKNSQFRDCFFKHMQFDNTIFEKPIFSNSKGFQGKLSSLSMSDCIVNESFSLKYLALNSFDIFDTVFSNTFEFEKVRISNLRIMDSKFKALVNYFNCDFYDFYIYKSTFDDFVGFEYSKFGLFEEGEKEGVCTKFTYVTFLSFVNFRNTVFRSGLELSEANFKEYPNFLGTEIDPTNTDVETYRIIKHSFDKVGNTVEANNYFFYEMNKARKDASFWEDPEKKILLNLNIIISMFGQSFLLPLVWIFILMIIHYLTLDWMDTFPNAFPSISKKLNELNGLVKNLIPYKRFLNPGTEFISLLFLIGYSTFIYHFIVAVKRRTKR